MKVCIIKPDPDTCLAALILGVNGRDEIVISGGIAPENDLADPSVLCIEAGGSGLVGLNNFDHHDPNKYFPPACRQAYERSHPAAGGQRSVKLERLVEYVCMVDDGPKADLRIEFPSLSNIFSGMLLVEKGQASQFLKGIEILKKTLERNIDPFSSMPDIEEWRPYKDAKIENQKKLDEVLRNAEFYESRSGVKIGFVQSDFIGGIGTLYAQGCDVVIMFNPAFGEPPVRKYTIAGNNNKVSHLLKFFDKIEKGWGGRETIIGSPRGGTAVSVEQALDIVRENI